MDAFRDFLSQRLDLLLLVQAALCILLIFLALLQRRQIVRYSLLSRPLGIPQAGDLLTQSLLRISSVEAAVARLERQFEADRDPLSTSIKHVGLVRFNAFGDIGGNQSFSLAAADSNGDGVVLTALNSREEFRFYAKPLKSWASPYPLSKEESEAIAAARRRRAAPDMA